MSSLTKLLSILEFFSLGNTVLTAEEIISKLGCSRPQGYRYIRELYSAGFLTRFSGAYSLGPRIIELDFIIRRGDPLLRSSEPLIRELRDRVACDIILAKMFGDHLVAIHHERCNDTNFVGYGRGRPMPLFRGSGYKLILAYLPSARQKRLFHQYPDAVKASNLGQTWEELRADLRKIRQAGYALSFGELDAVNVGISAPIFDEPNIPPIALTLIVPRTRYETSNQEMLAQIVTSVTSNISHHLQQQRAISPR
jgi:DNA-binding IclR family transcriptional regulator